MIFTNDAPLPLAHFYKKPSNIKLHCTMRQLNHPQPKATLTSPVAGMKTVSSTVPAFRKWGTVHGSMHVGASVKFKNKLND